MREPADQYDRCLMRRQYDGPPPPPQPPIRVGGFESLSPIALIPPLAIDPPNIPSFCYNGDIRVEHYEAPSGPYMSFQRNRLNTSDLRATSRLDFAMKSTQLPYPCAEISPTRN